MSVQSIDVTCSLCEFRSETGVSHGIFKYEIQNGLIDCDRELGWCESCKNLSPIEALPTEARIERVRILLKREQAALSASEKAGETANAGWRKALGIRPRASMETSILQDGCECRIREIQEITSRNESAGVLRPPRCLRCGSQTVIAMPAMPSGLDPEMASSQRPLPIGMEHPGCGGKLMASYSPFRLNRRFRTQIFSLDGTFLREQE
jgi:hypothetical protein